MSCVLCLVLGAASPASAGSGGAYASPPAVIEKVSCAARCASIDAVAAGNLLRVRGRVMRGVRQVVFLGADGPADDVAAPALRPRDKTVDVLVPDAALSGPVLAINRDGALSLPSRAFVSVQRAATSSAALDVRVVGRRVFYGAARHARVDLLAREPISVVVALVRLNDGAAVMGWPPGALVPGVISTVTWDGTIAGVPQPAGRYEFRVFAQDAPAQAAQAPPPAAPAAPPEAPPAAPALTPLATGSFDFVDHKFPIRGKHDFGEGIAAFGAGRGGRMHQGQDVFADCGTPLVAARGGVVKLNQSGGAAGNYLVIDGAGTDVDYAYMHLSERSPLPKGAPVMTGQVIGAVGRTGSASACHLHFELWAAPGWYTGGQPFDPLPFLTAWDGYS